MRAADVLALGSSECISVPKWLVHAAGGVIAGIVLQAAIARQAEHGPHTFWAGPNSAKAWTEWAHALSLDECELFAALDRLAEQHILEIENAQDPAPTRRFLVVAATVASLLEA